MFRIRSLWKGDWTAIVSQLLTNQMTAILTFKLMIQPTRTCKERASMGKALRTMCEPPDTGLIKIMFLSWLRSCLYGVHPTKFASVEPFVIQWGVICQSKQRYISPSDIVSLFSNLCLIQMLVFQTNAYAQHWCKFYMPTALVECALRFHQQGGPDNKIKTLCRPTTIICVLDCKHHAKRCILQRCVVCSKRPHATKITWMCKDMQFPLCLLGYGAIFAGLKSDC